LINGEKVSFGETKTNRIVGYLPDVPEFYNYLRPKEYLRLCGEITGLTKAQIEERSESLLTLVGLQNVKKKIGAFSRGMKQRLGIAQALLNEPKLLICDEPTSALDPIGRKEILDILLKVKGKTTVIFSTHILSDVERICDQIAVLHKGKVMLTGTLADIKAQHQSDGFEIDFASALDKARFMVIPELKAYMTNANSEGLSLILHHEDSLLLESIVLQALVTHKIYPSRFEINEPTIESLFMEAVS
jgi:ABC-2 type transport system ATP-binding protein